MTTSNPICYICDLSDAAVEFFQQCYSCGQTFHLNPFSNKPGKDCGDAILGESQGLYYYCELCLTQTQEPA